MFKSISYKKKVIYSSLLFLLLLMASYKKNFKDIFAINKQLAEIEKRKNIDDINTTVFYLQREIDVLEDLIGGVDVNPERVQQRLLNFITASSLEITINSFDEVHISSNEQFKIYTHRISIEGDYKNLILFLQTLEKDFDLSKIASANLEVKNNYRRKRKELFLNILFQNYEKI